MNPWLEARLRRKLYEAAVAVHLAKIALDEAQRELDRLYREVERRGRWNQKRRDRRAGA
jgi:hypothetical protein